jgi:hypothetical protein
MPPYGGKRIGTKRKFNVEAYGQPIFTKKSPSAIIRTVFDPIGSLKSTNKFSFIEALN